MSPLTLSEGLRSAVCLIATLAALSSLPATAEGCATPDELVAAAVRILQIDLQVAALECASVPGSTRGRDYNEFVLRNRPRLLLAIGILQEHYRRTASGDPAASLDAFDTAAANSAALRHLSDPTRCLALDSALARAYALGGRELQTEAARAAGEAAEALGATCAMASVR
jgi:hypothetical protein